MGLCLQGSSYRFFLAIYEAPKILEIVEEISDKILFFGEDSIRYHRQCNFWWVLLLEILDM